MEAIGREEGVLVKGSRAQRNCNPGNITWGKWARAHGATHAEYPLLRYAVFPNMAAGYEALRALLASTGYIALTVAQVLERWAPPTENDTATYIHDVCAWVGCSPDTPVRGLVPSALPAALATPASAGN